MKILIVGAGMYVTGRFHTGHGTILSSILESSKTINIESVIVVARGEANRSEVEHITERINKRLRTNVKVEFIRISGDPEKLKDEILNSNKFDCAIVCTPDHLHYSFTKELLLNNIHCLVVKPFTTTHKEAEELAMLQKQKGLFGAVEFHKRYDETNLYTKKIIAEGQLGELLYITVDYSQRISIPTKVFRDWADHSNIFQYLAVHYVDLIHFITGYVPIRAQGIGIYGIVKESGVNTYDTVNATIIWKNKNDHKKIMVSQFATNWIDPERSSAMSDQRYKIVGTKGRIECDQKNRGVELWHSEMGVLHINPYFSEYLIDENGNDQYCGYGYKSFHQYLKDIKDLNENKITLEVLNEKRPSFSNSLISSYVIEAVNKSLNNNFNWVEIDDEF